MIWRNSWRHQRSNFPLILTSGKSGIGDRKMKSAAARRARRGEVETKGKEKVTVGQKWRNEMKDREELKRGSRTDQREVLAEGRKVEVKVRADKRLSCGEQNGNLCSDQRAALWRQEGGKSPADDVRSFHLYQSGAENEPRQLSFMCSNKGKGEMAGLLGLKRPFRRWTALTRGSGVLNQRVECQRVGRIRTSCPGLVAPPHSQDPRHWFHWWFKENGPNTEELRTHLGA